MPELLHRIDTDSLGLLQGVKNLKEKEERAIVDRIRIDSSLALSINLVDLAELMVCIGETLNDDVAVRWSCSAHADKVLVSSACGFQRKPRHESGPKINKHLPC